MTIPRNVIACVLLALLATGCNKASDPPRPTMSAPSASGSASVALPPAAVPQSDAAIKPASADAARGTDSTNPSQANPNQMSKEQESSSMPMPGQANTHSTPEPLDKTRN